MTTQQDELLTRLNRLGNSDAHWEIYKLVADEIRSLQAKLAYVNEKYRLLSAQYSRLCDEVYEEDGETLKIVAERKAREEAEHAMKLTHQLRSNPCLRKVLHFPKM